MTSPGCSGYIEDRLIIFVRSVILELTRVLGHILAVPGHGEHIDDRLLGWCWSTLVRPAGAPEFHATCIK